MLWAECKCGDAAPSDSEEDSEDEDEVPTLGV